MENAKFDLISARLEIFLEKCFFAVSLIYNITVVTQRNSLNKSQEFLQTFYQYNISSSVLVWEHLITADGYFSELANLTVNST